MEPHPPSQSDSMPKAARTARRLAEPGWQSIGAQPEVLPSRNFPDKKKGTTTVAFDDDEERVAALSTWTAARTKWATAERPAIAARQLFERIHAPWTTMQRGGDRVELVLGDGMLGVPDQLIRHPGCYST